MEKVVLNKDVKAIAKKLDVPEGLEKKIVENKDGSLSVEFVDVKTDVRYSTRFIETNIEGAKATTRLEVQTSRPSYTEAGERLCCLDVYETEPMTLEGIHVLENNLRSMVDGFETLVDYFDSKLLLLKTKDTKLAREMHKLLLLNLSASFDLINHIADSSLPNIAIMIHDGYLIVISRHDETDYERRHFQFKEMMTETVQEVRAAVCEILQNHGVDFMLEPIWKLYEDKIEGFSSKEEHGRFELSTLEFDSLKDRHQAISGKLVVDLDLDDDNNKKAFRVEKHFAGKGRTEIQEESFVIEDILAKPLVYRSMIASFMNSDVVRDFKELQYLTKTEEKVFEAYQRFKEDVDGEIEIPELDRFYGGGNLAGLPLAGKYSIVFGYSVVEENDEEVDRFSVGVGLLKDGKYLGVFEEDDILPEDLIETIKSIQAVFNFDNLKERIDGTKWSLAIAFGTFTLVNREEGIAIELTLDADLRAFRAEFFGRGFPGGVNANFAFSLDLPLEQILELVLEKETLDKFRNTTKDVFELFSKRLPVSANVEYNEVDEASLSKEM